MLCPFLSATIVLLPGQSPPALKIAPDIATLSLDEWIEQLPPTGSDSSWNSEAKKYDCPPEAAEFELRLRTGILLTDAQWRAALAHTGAIRWRSK